MASTIITYTNQPQQLATPKHTVSVKSKWTDGWTEVPHLYCDWCVKAAAPEISQAQLTWHYGRLLRPDSLSWSPTSPKNLLRQFVKIEIAGKEATSEPAITWTGIIEAQIADPQGREPGEPASGRQAFVCYGLELLLERHIILQSKAFDNAGKEVTIERGLEFNERIHAIEKGNRSKQASSKGPYLFAGSLDDADFWDTLKATNYLLTWIGPQNNSGGSTIRWQLDAAAVNGVLPDWDKPRKATHGQSLKHVLDALMAKRRMVGYRVEARGDEVDVKAFTHTPTDVVFEGNKIPANQSQKEIVIQAAPDAAAVVLDRSSLQKFDQVLVRGSRAVSCFTIAKADGTLDKGWTESLQTDYEEGAAGDPAYSALDPYLKQRRDNDARAADSLARVFSYFNLPKDWNGKVGDGEGGSKSPFFPGPGSQSEPPTVYLPQFRFKGRLPLRTDRDYTGTRIRDGEITKSEPSGVKTEFRKLISLIKLKDQPISGQPNAPARYQHLERTSANSLVEGSGDDTGRIWSASTRCQEDGAGVVFNVSGAAQHAIAGTDYTLTQFDEPVGTHDWKDVIVTVAAEVDAYAEGKYPDQLTESIDSVRRTVIDVGDEYQLHYVAPNTVVDLDPVEGKLLKSSSGGYIRDDRQKLTALARLAYEWYGVVRQGMQITLQRITGRIEVGDLITKLDDGTGEFIINTVVRSVRWDFAESSGARPGPPRTTITTADIDVDFASFV